MVSPSEVLFIHPTKELDRDLPIYLLPMGVFSMSDQLHQAGVKTEIIHPSLERALDPDFDPVDYVKKVRPSLVALDLHWHQQTTQTIDLCRAIKKAHPTCRTVVGGYTASGFAPTILNAYDCVDFVIAGDGEMAMLRLAEAVLGESGDLAKVPNLFYREGGQAKRSSAFHVNHSEDLDRYRYSNFDLMRNQELYNQRGIMEGKINVGSPKTPGFFYCNLGRGCPYNCLFCGGSFDAQNILAGREKIAYRSHDAMLSDLERMAQFNLDTWYNTFQPSPNERRYLDLYERVRVENIGISAVQECLHLPSEKFLRDFSRTFGPNSRMDYVPYNANDWLRRKNKDNYFSAADLVDTLARAEALGIRSDLCFLTGLPYETEAHIRETIEFAEMIGRRFEFTKIGAEILTIEPLSVMSRDPDGCGIKVHANTVEDYYEGHRESDFIGFEPENYGPQQAKAFAKQIEAAWHKGRASAGRGRTSTPRASVLSGPRHSQGNNTVPVTDLAGLGGRLLGRFVGLDSAAREKYELGEWVAVGSPEQIKHHDVTAIQLTFSNGERRLAVDLLNPDWLSAPPAAKGAHLAFCPSDEEAQRQNPEAMRRICLTLADLDKEAP